MIDLALMKTLFDRTRGRVKYRLGAKCALDADSATITHIDCSGFSRWILYRASDGAIKMPDGSQAQLEWVRVQHWHKLASYWDVQHARKDPSRLFIAFLSPKPGNAWPRHVWYVQAGVTMESHGSGGVNSRPWDELNLRGCKACFEVPTG